MFIGFLYAMGACFLWGMIFVIPEFLDDFSAVEVVVGRYFAYGTLSAVLLFRKGFSCLKRYHSKALLMAMLSALFSNILYYLGVVAGVRLVSPALTILLVGMTPIVISLYGNWSVREIPYKKLMIPCIGIAFGMILVNFVEIDWSFSTSTVKEYLLGIAGILVALAGWSWYAVKNARFLKRHPHIPPSEWATVIGVGTLLWTFVLGLIFLAAGNKGTAFLSHFSWTMSTWRFLGGILVLGVVCSWLGCFLWNKASTHLPISLMGSFLILETIFGLTFVFLFQQKFPSWLELLGVGSMLGGIMLSIYSFRKKHFMQNKI